MRESVLSRHWNKALCSSSLGTRHAFGSLFVGVCHAEPLVQSMDRIMGCMEGVLQWTSRCWHGHGHGPHGGHTAWQVRVERELRDAAPHMDMDHMVAVARLGPTSSEAIEGNPFSEQYLVVSYSESDCSHMLSASLGSRPLGDQHAVHKCNHERVP